MYRSGDLCLCLEKEGEEKKVWIGVVWRCVYVWVFGQKCSSDHSSFVKNQNEMPVCVILTLFSIQNPTPNAVPTFPSLCRGGRGAVFHRV